MTFDLQTARPDYTPERAITVHKDADEINCSRDAFVHIEFVRGTFNAVYEDAGEVRCRYTGDSLTDAVREAERLADQYEAPFLIAGYSTVAFDGRAKQTA